MMTTGDAKKLSGHPESQTAVSRQPGPRRRLRVTPNRSNPKLVTIEATLRTSDEADAFYKNWDNAKFRNSNKILAAIKVVANEPPKKQRPRDGYLQPSVPKLLRTQLAQKGGRRAGARLLRDWFARGIDPDTGKRLKDGEGRKKRPGHPADFVAAGRNLFKRAKEGCDGDSLVRYTLDAMKMKPGIEELARHLNVTISELVTAAMDRVCNPGRSRRRS